MLNTGAASVSSNSPPVTSGPLCPGAAPADRLSPCHGKGRALEAANGHLSRLLPPSPPTASSPLTQPAGASWVPPQHQPPPVGCPPSARVPNPPEAPLAWTLLAWIHPAAPDPPNLQHRREQAQGPAVGALSDLGSAGLRSPTVQAQGGLFRAPRTPAPVPSRLDAVDTPGKWLHARLAGETPGLRRSAAAWPNPGGWPWAGRRLLNSLQGPFSLFKNGTDAHRTRALHHVSGISCMRDGV